MPIAKESNKSRRRVRGSRTQSESDSQTLAIGVDIGGTKVAAGIVDCTSGKVHELTRLPMPADGTPEQGLAAAKLVIDELLRKSVPNARGVGAIGLCAPGPLDPRTGVVINPPNVPCWRNFPLAERISKSYGLPVKLDNDANAAGLAETIWGAGRGYQNVFYATIGTGIGTGIILNGQILHGRTGAAGEGGHVSIDYRGPKCACGKRGCIEVLAAGPAIARAAQLELRKRPHDSNVLLALANGRPDKITSEMVGQAAAKRDRVAKDVLEQATEYLSHWLGNIIDLLEPEIIIIGGGVSLMLEPFLKDISKRLPGCCENQRSCEIPIVPAWFGENAGIAGAAALCGEFVRHEAAAQ